MGRPLLALLLLLAALLAPAAAAPGVGFEFHHRFSDRVREWAEARTVPGNWWPEKGTAEYYTALAHHDRALRGRSLAGGNATELAFADGNATVRISALGFLHYAIVALGTPNVTFLVALDTGSDLFWVPCDCQQCSSITLGDIEFDTYSPSNSSTSQKVLCSNNLCSHQSSCASETSSCPYSVEYLSANTSSSGVLVEDILYLTTEDENPQVVEAPIVFGCGVKQTGGFLSGAAPNGLFGLGMENISVPSILASKGFTSNSFSMCFSGDGFGRINFGDTGSSDQQETAFIVDKRNPTYKINITGIKVGANSTDMVFDAIVDSGTSFTLLADPMYTFITKSFNVQVQEKRVIVAPNFTFEYCYELKPTQTSPNFIPDINLTTKGGSVFPVNHPLIIVKTETSDFYCLALLKIDDGANINIIGQNFLTGLRVVFDRDRLALGWKEFDCYAVDNSSALSVRNPSSLPTAPAPSGYNQEMANAGRNSAGVPLSSPPSSGSSLSKTTSTLSLAFLTLCLAIF
ncbi:aspartyl protease family protein 1-like isoform X1 [Canna indica]|uniref:Aspartyl protease family protein 1-like isoform X1 n=1 Tax=Canna indica TaxID=4628 RepID=A0AAQ3QLE9_9LILI|nr:aspartyl protease family protein 1-like isoform X1 [Canna indica]